MSRDKVFYGVVFDVLGNSFGMRKFREMAEANMAQFFVSVWLGKSNESTVLRIVLSESKSTRYSYARVVFLQHGMVWMMSCFS